MKPIPVLASCSPMRSSTPMRSASPMRQGSDFAANTSSYTSTSTLLQEISSLRARLRELEEDSRSSVISSTVDDKESQLVLMMRKDYAQLEQEKALQEKDFLNQISNLQAEHQNRIKELHEKLAKSDGLNKILSEKLLKDSDEKDDLTAKLDNALLENETLKKEITVANSKLERSISEGKVTRSKSDTEEKYMKLLEEQRESHMKEIEQIKANLETADLEIAEFRDEIDSLQEELFELRTHRETLLAEITNIRLELSEEQRTRELLNSELSEVRTKNDQLLLEVERKAKQIATTSEEIAKLEQQLERLSSTNTSFSKQIEEKNSTITRLQKHIDELKSKSPQQEDQKSILHTAVAHLKSKNLQKTKDHPLQINTRFHNDENNVADDAPISPTEKAQIVKDMETLEARLVAFHSKMADKDCKIDDLTTKLSAERETNKKLKEQIDALKGKSDEGAQHLPFKGNEMQSELAFLRNQNKILNDEITALRKTRGEMKPSPVRSRARSASIDRNSPGKLSLPPTSVAAPSSTTRKIFATPRTPVSGLVATFEKGINSSSPESQQQVHEKENDLTRDLQEQLRRERNNVQELKEQLHAEQQLVANLKMHLMGETSSSELASTYNIATQLQESRREVRRLQTKLADVRTSQTSEQVGKVKENEELTTQRSKLLSYNSQKENYEKTIRENMKEIEELKARLDGLSRKSEQNDEEKNAIHELRAKVKAKDEELENVRSKYCNLEQEKNLARDRLTVQVKALQSELEAATYEIESLQSELDRMSEDSSREKDKLKEALAKAELDLTMNKARQAETEVEYHSKIQSLEEQINALASKNANLLMEVHPEKQKEFEEKNAKLTSELLNTQMKMADQEMMFSIETKKLESKIMSLENQLENANSHITNLMKELEETQSSLQDSKNLADNTKKDFEEKIGRLTAEIAKSQKGRADFERENAAVLASLENQLETLESQAEAEVRNRDDQIAKLREELVEKNEEISRLEQAKTDLRGNLAASSFSRQDEVRQLESELLDLTNRTHAQAREIESLKLEIQERDIRKQDSCVVHQRRIQDLEDEILELKQSGKNQGERDAFAKIKAENQRLRDSIREIKSDRRALQEKLNSLLEERSSSRSAQNLRERNQALKHEVEKLTKRLRKMEASITRFAI